MNSSIKIRNRNNSDVNSSLLDPIQETLESNPSVDEKDNANT